METIVIVTFGVMLIIALLQLRSKKIDNSILSNKLYAEAKDNLENIRLKEFTESELKRSQSKLSRLNDKYNTALFAINERDDVIRLRDLEITKLEKTKKEYSARVYELSNEKAIAVKETRSAIKLCKESVATVAQLRAELDTMELLLTKYTPQL
jgi:hypothetical protein